MRRSPPEPLYVLRGDAKQIHCILFSITSQAEILYAGDTDGNVHVWNLKTNKKITRFSCSDVACLSIFSIGDDVIVTQDKKCALNAWKMVDDDYTLIFARQFNNVSFCKIDAYRDRFEEDAYIAIPQSNSLVRVCRAKKKKEDGGGGCVFVVEEYKTIGCGTADEGDAKYGEVMQIKFVRSAIIADADERLIIFILYENGSVIAKRLINDRIVFEEKLTTNTSSMATCFDVDATKFQMVCGATDKTLVFAKFDENWSSSSMICKRVEITNPGVACLRIRPDGKIVAAGCWDGRLRIFSWSSCKLLAVMNYHTESILDVRFAEISTKYWKSKHLLAAGGADRKISLWSIYE